MASEKLVQNTSKSMPKCILAECFACLNKKIRWYRIKQCTIVVQMHCQDVKVEGGQDSAGMCGVATRRIS